MKIENREMLLYSMDKAISEAFASMHREDEQEIYYRVGTALHWIIDCFDRIAEVKMEIFPEDEKYRMALHAANNALKHRPDLIQLHESKQGLNMPMFSFFPAKLYVWANIDEVKLNGDKQKVLYKELLEGKLLAAYLVEYRQ